MAIRSLVLLVAAFVVVTTPVAQIVRNLLVWLFSLAIAVVVTLAMSEAAKASDYGYSYNGGTVYERYQEPYSYWYCGRQYTAYRWAYRPVVSRKDENWRSKAINLLYASKEADAFQTFVETLLPPQPQQYGGQPSGVGGFPYPSETGNVLGGFSALEYSRYGSTTPLDLNKASERVALQIDQFTRTSADNQRRADEVHGGIGSLIQSNAAQVGAIAELQETRQAMQSVGETMRGMMLAQAEQIRAIKPQPSESFSAVQASEGALQARQAASASITERFCGKCHGPNTATPAGGYYLSSDVALSRADLGEILLRIDPQANAQENGKAFRMPPQGESQPSDAERRAIIGELRDRVR